MYEKIKLILRQEHSPGTKDLYIMQLPDNVGLMCLPKAYHFGELDEENTEVLHRRHLPPARRDIFESPQSKKNAFLYSIPLFIETKTGSELFLGVFFIRRNQMFFPVEATPQLDELIFDMNRVYSQQDLKHCPPISMQRPPRQEFVKTFERVHSLRLIPVGANLIKPLSSFLLPGYLIEILDQSQQKGEPGYESEASFKGLLAKYQSLEVAYFIQRAGRSKDECPRTLHTSIFTS
ncbi:hypothetical protein C8J56DRAFT_1162294 [Mycena floridula]|nr:hypothetical protein C8J56DRAFT_1162294 [Mycena floridula]